MPKKALEQTIFVGKQGNPRAFIKRNEIESYLDKEFFAMYKLWKMFHIGMGLPDNKPWNQLPCHVANIIETFQDEYIYMRQ